MDITLLEKGVHLLNDLTPTGLLAGCIWIIYLMVAKKGPVQKLSNNHLSGLPSMELSLTKLVEAAGRQETLLGNINDNVNQLKGAARVD